jgi:hypothetical protein
MAGHCAPHHTPVRHTGTKKHINYQALHGTAGCVTALHRMASHHLPIMACTTKYCTTEYIANHAQHIMPQQCTRSKAVHLIVTLHDTAFQSLPKQCTFSVMCVYSLYHNVFPPRASGSDWTQTRDLGMMRRVFYHCAIAATR